MWRILDSEIPAEDRLAKATERMLDHVCRTHIDERQRKHAKSWAREAAHAVFDLHPELREEGSLFRYFVAKSGRHKGLRGVDLTDFIEREYQQGTWWHLVPEDVLLGKPKP